MMKRTYAMLLALLLLLTALPTAALAYSYGTTTGGYGTTGGPVNPPPGQYPAAEPEPCEHVWGPWTTEILATCVEKGLDYKECQLCGERRYMTIPMTSHKFGPWTTVKEPQVGVAGLEERTCTVCGKVEQNRLAPLTEDRDPDAPPAREPEYGLHLDASVEPEENYEGKERAWYDIIITSTGDDVVFDYIVFQKVEGDYGGSQPYDELITAGGSLEIDTWGCNIDIVMTNGSLITDGYYITYVTAYGHPVDGEPHSVKSNTVTLKIKMPAGKTDDDPVRPDPDPNDPTKPGTDPNDPTKPGTDPNDPTKPDPDPILPEPDPDDPSTPLPKPEDPEEPIVGPLPDPDPADPASPDPDPTSPLPPIFTPGSYDPSVNPGSFLPAEGVADCCKRTLLGMGNAQENYSVHFCAEHAAIYAHSLAAAADARNALIAWWEAAEDWMSAIDALYDSLDKRAQGAAGQLLALEKEQFLALAAVREQSLNLLYQDEPVIAAEKYADFLRDHCAALCYLSATAPGARADLYTAATPLPAALGAVPSCVSDFTAEENDNLLAIHLCEAHGASLDSILPLLKFAPDTTGIHLSMQGLWLDSMDKLYMTWRMAETGNARSLVLNDRAAFGAWLSAEEALLYAFYPEQKPVVSELVATLLRGRVTELDEMLSK